MITENDLRQILRHRCEQAGGIYAWSKANGVDGGYTSNVLRGRIGLGKQIATALGYQKKVSFIACNAGSDV